MPSRERSLRVKNRMRVIRSSGSVRGGDGNIPAYSARRLDDRSGPPLGVIEAIEAGESIGLHDARVSGEMFAGMIAGAMRE